MKKGFTLTELLVVIAIIGVISAIAVPSIILINNNINKRNYNNKVDMIVSAAELYASNKPEIFNGQIEVKVYVAELLNADYLKVEDTKDGDGTSCTTTTITDGDENKSIDTKGCILNPETKESMNADYVLLRNETVGVVATFKGEPKSIENEQLVKVVCDKLQDGSFIGKYDESDDATCKCVYEDNENQTGDIVGLVATGPSDKVGNTNIEACIISGYEKNNYLYYDNMYWRVVGLYNLDDEKGGYGVVPKLITDDGIELE